MNNKSVVKTNILGEIREDNNEYLPNESQKKNMYGHQ